MQHFLLTELLYGYNTVFNCVAFVGAALGDYSGGEGGNLIVTIGESSGTYTFEVDGVSYTYNEPGSIKSWSFANAKTLSLPAPKTGTGITNLKINGDNITPIENNRMSAVGEKYVFDNLTGVTTISFILN